MMVMLMVLLLMTMMTMMVMLMMMTVMMVFLILQLAMRWVDGGMRIAVHATISTVSDAPRFSSHPTAVD